MKLPTFERAGATPCDALLLHASTAQLLPVAERAGWLSLLSEDERARHARFHFDTDRNTFLVAHGLLRLALARLTSAPAHAFSFLAGEHGRPELSGPKAALGIRFNLSHTRGHVACGFTRGPDIGVDVEETLRDVRIDDVAQRVYSTVELGAMRALAPEAQRDRFFELWTLKEAYIKAIGKGFSAPLKAITFHADAPDPVPLTLGPEIVDDAASYCARRFAIGAEHALAIVWRGRDPNAVECRRVTAEDLSA